LPAATESYESLVERRQDLLRKWESGESLSVEVTGEAGLPAARRGQETRTERARIQQEVVELEQREIAAQAELVAREREWSQLRQQDGDSSRDSAEPNTHARQLARRLRWLDARLARWNRTLREVAAARLSIGDRLSRNRLDEHSDAMKNGLAPRYRRLVLEGKRLARCEEELRQAVRVLVRRRRGVIRRMAAASTLADPSEVLHSSGPDATADVLTSRRAHPRRVSSRVARADKARRRARRTLDGVSTALAQARERLRRAGGALTGLRARSQPYQEALAELDRLLEIADSRQQLEQAVLAQESESRRLREEMRPLSDDASRFLVRLSCGKWKTLCVSSPHDTHVESSEGRLVPVAEVDEASRDQIYLSACLAIAAACRRRGLEVPLLINALFDHFPSRQVSDALTLLREMGADRQIICLSRHEHVASVARTMGIPVHQLPAAEPEQPEQVYAMHSRGIVGADSAACYLSESDPIERVPTVDAGTAALLRGDRISQIRDLLRSSGEELAVRLRTSGITVQMVQDWQAVARLLTRVPGLQPYDARILVACGVWDPEQLQGKHFGELRERVKKLASSVDGRAVLLSGTENELSRISDWLQISPVERPRGQRVVIRRGDVLDEVWAHNKPIKRRFAQVGIRTLAELLEADPDTIAARVKLPKVTGSTVRRWQQQADLLNRVPQLRGWHLRTLTAVGVASVEALASQVPHELWRHLQQFFGRTREGKQLFAEGHELSVRQIGDWVQAARSARTRAAA
jgi:hypothetical protein